MDRYKTVETLEALASGCSPTTGAMIDNDSVLNERLVIRALQSAIDQINANAPETRPESMVSKADLTSAIELYIERGRKPTAVSLMGFYLGTRSFKDELLQSNNLYGKYRRTFGIERLYDTLQEYLVTHNIADRYDRHVNPYREIDFFQKETFNRLSDAAVKHLEERVRGLGFQKTENLSEHVRNARLEHRRAYEPWTEKEKQLLAEAIKHTNDLELLSSCFQRGKGSIESWGQRLIWETQQNSNVRSPNTTPDVGWINFT